MANRLWKSLSGLAQSNGYGDGAPDGDAWLGGPPVVGDSIFLCVLGGQYYFWI